MIELPASGRERTVAGVLVGGAVLFVGFGIPRLASAGFAGALTLPLVLLWDEPDETAEDAAQPEPVVLIETSVLDVVELTRPALDPAAEPTPEPASEPQPEPASGKVPDLANDQEERTR
ncbi:MAG: hypothetical protein ACR2G2_15595 [Pseudonocardia sp.]